MFDFVQPRLSLGAPRSMKMGTTASLGRCDAAPGKFSDARTCDGLRSTWVYECPCLAAALLLLGSWPWT